MVVLKGVAWKPDKFENNDFVRSSGMKEEWKRWATTSVSANTKTAGTLLLQWYCNKLPDPKTPVRPAVITRQFREYS